ncbi:hypothetical protein O4H25_13845, partial [Staphylococcus equorum]
TNIAQFIPLTQFLSGFRKIAFYDGGLTSITPELGMLLLITAVSFILMVILLQVKIYRFGKKNKIVGNEIDE